MAIAFDKRALGFGVLNLVQGLLVGAIPVLVESRLPHVDWVLGVSAILMLVAAPAVVFGGAWGRRFAAAVCVVHWIIGVIFAVLILSSASYLYGIYGHHGHAVGSLGFVFAIIVLILFWLIPGHELAYLRKRAGMNPAPTGNARGASR